MNKLPRNGIFLCMEDETVLTLNLTWVCIKGNWAVGAESGPMIQSAPKWGEDQGVIWTHDVGEWQSASQALVIEFPGAAEIKVKLLATNEIKSQ